MSKKKKTILTLITVAVLLALLIFLEQNKAKYNMAVSTLQKGAILAIVAVSMNLLNGFTGLFSLGQAGFMAIGAYVTAILIVPTESVEGVYYISGMNDGLFAFKQALEALPDPVLIGIAIIIGGLVAALFAALIGIPVLRLKSDYLAIATLGFSEIIRALINSSQMDTITNGSYGISKIPGFGSTWGTLLIPFGVAAVCIAFIVLLIRSSYGRAFKAIREDEVAAEAMGINLFKHKQLAFVISSFFAAVAGGLLAMYMNSIQADTFKIALTYDILLIVVIGGVGSVTGSVLGAFLITMAKEWWLRFFDEPQFIGGWEVPLFKTGFRMVIFSILLMVVVLFYRRGIMGTNEFSWDAIASWPKKIAAKFKRKKKTEVE